MTPTPEKKCCEKCEKHVRDRSFIGAGSSRRSMTGVHCECKKPSCPCHSVPAGEKMKKAGEEISQRFGKAIERLGDVPAGDKKFCANPECDGNLEVVPGGHLHPAGEELENAEMESIVGEVERAIEHQENVGDILRGRINALLSSHSRSLVERIEKAVLPTEYHKKGHPKVCNACEHRKTWNGALYKAIEIVSSLTPHNPTQE